MVPSTSNPWARPRSNRRVVRQGPGVTETQIFEILELGIAQTVCTLLDGQASVQGVGRTSLPSWSEKVD